MLIRIITALILAPLALAGIYLLDWPVFAAVVAAIIALASYEWAGLVFATGSGQQADSEAPGADALPASATNNPTARFITAMVFVSTVLAICGWLWLRPEMLSRWMLVSAVCWAWAIIEVLIYPRQMPPVSEAGRRPNLRWILFGLVVLPGAWAGMLSLKSSDPHFLVFACFLVWGADAGAYFVGKAVGRRKLAPKVSPGKTWEGALGGGIVGVLVALGFGLLTAAVVREQPLMTFALLVVLVAVSVFGDLFESILKRTAGAKDSGRLLPGHGGILDRIDALIAVMPLMALYVLWAQYGSF